MLFGIIQYPCPDSNGDNRLRRSAFYPLELQGQRGHYNTITYHGKVFLSDGKAYRT
jgi:hypothetical protein